MSGIRCSGIAAAGRCCPRSSPCISKVNRARSEATGRGETPSGLVPRHSRPPRGRTLVPRGPGVGRGIPTSRCSLPPWLRAGGPAGLGALARPEDPAQERTETEDGGTTAAGGPVWYPETIRPRPTTRVEWVATVWAATAPGANGGTGAEIPKPVPPWVCHRSLPPGENPVQTCLRPGSWGGSAGG